MSGYVCLLPFQILPFIYYLSDLVHGPFSTKCGTQLNAGQKFDTLEIILSEKQHFSKQFQQSQKLLNVRNFE